MRTILILAVAVLGAASCKKTETAYYQSEGEILGPDGRYCAACGGYFVQIDNMPKEYRTFSLPAGSGIDLQNDVKPIPVRLNWHLDSGVSGEWGVIVIDAIERR